MSPNSLRSDCRKFAPNIFNKSKCSNCFKQKEEHTAEALECQRAMRKVAKSGYLFVAPGWDFSIPLNRTKRWQRRWFVLYDDGELNYSVDEHPDTVPQASIDMTSVLEVAGAEEVTGHAFSLAITAPDRVTFVKAMARDDARAWTSVLAVYTRNKGRHKRNATFPGGQTTTIHQTQVLPRSGTPNPIRPRYNSCHSDSALRPAARWTQDPVPPPSLPAAVPSPTSTASISPSSSSSSCRSAGYRDQPASSASPPTRDKLNSEEKAAVRTRTRQQHAANTTTTTTNHTTHPTTTTSTATAGGSDCVDGLIPDYETSSRRLETLKDIAEVLTRPRSATSPTSASQPPPTRDSDTDAPPALGGPHTVAELRVELPAETLLHLKKGWLMLQQGDAWTKLWFVLCGGALTAYRDPRGEEMGAAPEVAVSLGQVKSVVEAQVQRNYGFQIRLWNDAVHTLSAVTSGIRSNWLHAVRRAAGLDELPPRPTPAPCPRPMLLSSDEEYRTASEGGRRGSGDWAPASPPLARTPMSRVKERARSRSAPRSNPSSRASTLDSVSTDELIAADELQRLHATLQRTERQLLSVTSTLKDKDDFLNETLEKYQQLNQDYQAKLHANTALQEQLNCLNERLRRGIEENDFLYKKLQELNTANFGSLSDLTNIDLNLDFSNITKDEYNNLRCRFEKAVQEIRAMKRELRNSHLKYDDLELSNITLKQDLKREQEENQAQNTMMAARIQDLTVKLTASEKQVRNLKSKLQDSREKRRSLSLKGKESFSINKEVEDKITELEAKILELNKRTVKPNKKIVEDRNQRRLRRKSLDSATTSEPMKVLIRLSSLETKVANISVKDETSESIQTDPNSKIFALESTLEAAREKLTECINLKAPLSELSNILNVNPAEVNVLSESVRSVVKSFEKLLAKKLTDLSDKRRALLESGKLTPQTSLNLVAEKLAYESVLISRIHEALNTAHSEDSRFSARIIRREILETEQLAQQLHAKLTGSLPVSEEHLTRVLTRKLIQVGFLTNNNRVVNFKQHDWRKTLEYLRNKQKEINELVQQYKSNKLEQLAYGFNFDKDVKEAWRAAQDTVNSELVQEEVSSMMLRMAQMYSSNTNEVFFSLFAAERAALELWTELVQTRLKTELDLAETELHACVSSRPQPRAKHLLVEFADILAHKALVDARVAVLSGEVELTPGDLAEDGDQAVLQAEWAAVWTRCLGEAAAAAVPGLQAVEQEVARLEGTDAVAEGPTTWPDVAARCAELQQRLAKIPQSCTQCQHLKDSLHRLSLEHEASVACHESTQAQLREHARQLDSEYTRQLSQLRAAWGEGGAGDGGGAAGDGLRARYQAEIEQLRALCEKGLAAVESSHRRVVAELQHKHEREREQLRRDKEQALAEETQATLAALDAMRKAHEHEVRREVSKFKADFLRRLQATREQPEHEAEMRDIKQEILALSERYSVKCVESAALEERLGAVQRQLGVATRRAQQLDKRNQQLAEQLARDGCKPKITTQIRNPQLSPMQN